MSSSDSSEEEQGAKAQVKQEQLPSVPGSLTKAREVMSRIRERSHQPRAGTKRPKLHQDAEVKTERVKTEKPHAPVAPKSSSLPAKLSATSELPDSHRRPSKQHQRGKAAIYGHNPNTLLTIPVVVTLQFQRCQNLQLMHIIHQLRLRQQPTIL